MSYSTMGSYYEFSPHEIFPASGMGCGCSGVGCGCSGFGALGEGCGCSGFGALGEGCGCSGFGAFGEDRAKAIGFSAAKVWGYVQKSNACYAPTGAHFKTCQKSPQPATPCGNCNYNSGKAAALIQAGLHELGYDAGTVGAPWSGAVSAAWKQFTSDIGVPSGPGLANQAGLIAMEDQLQQGNTPGPKPTKYKKVNGTLIKETKTGLAGMGGLGIGLLLVAAAGLGYVAYRGKKKKGPGFVRTGSFGRRYR
jgi:hypothetical protein